MHLLWLHDVFASLLRLSAFLRQRRYHRVVDQAGIYPSTQEQGQRCLMLTAPTDGLRQRKKAHLALKSGNLRGKTSKM
jgi:hypothetical protein